MILNNLVFPIKLGAKFVEGSIPTGYLTANDINKDMVYVISPEVGATNITLTLQNSKQSEKEVRAFMKPSSISVDMLVSKDESYYDLIKDWNVWQCFLPSKALAFVSYNRANQIGISFGFRQATVPRMEGFNFIGNITSSDFIPNQNGYYINKTALYIYNGLELTYNDVLIKQGDEFLVRKAIITSINTSTLEYDVDPSVYDSDIETIDIGIAESLILQANGILDDINFINFRLNDIYYEIIRLDERIDEIQDDISLSVKIDYYTITRNDLNELQVSNKVINDINSRTKNDDFVAYQQLVQDFLNDKLNKKPDGNNDLITPLNKIDARYLDIDTELFIVVLSLPAIGIPNKIYLVPKSESETQNLYDEFIYLDNNWEKLGTITIDLSNFYSKQEVDLLLSTKANIADIPKAIPKTPDMISPVGIDSDGYLWVATKKDAVVIKVREMGSLNTTVSYEGNIQPNLTHIDSGGFRVYSNTFDDIFPFNEMKEVSDEFNNKFITIPPIYFKFYHDVDNNITGYDISNEKIDNDYKLFPIHEKGTLMIGKYQAYTQSGKLTSISGVEPTMSTPIESYRTEATAVGDKYFANDWQSWNILQLLLTAYFGTTNNDLYFPDVDGAKSNTGTMDGYKTSYNITSGKNTFFGIENILKNGYHFIDGVINEHSSVSFAKDYTKYSNTITSDYELKGYKPAANSYIKSYGGGIGMFPTVNTGASSTTYYCDQLYQSVGLNVLFIGSSWDADAARGVWRWSANLDFSRTLPNIGSRLIKYS